MGKWPERFRDETRTIDDLVVGDLVINLPKLERFFDAVWFDALVIYFEGSIKILKQASIGQGLMRVLQESARVRSALGSMEVLGIKQKKIQKSDASN
ncbi:hypothetical protein IQ270_03570 [Microcoleus sp. LEGE 07076]|uniref:hypothetical protein n=1 Tax=Microcoleus sp. LEGE 07076 TaxID=915322 RepID=UPI00187FFFE4|nr:hypothetical protein [Microcoleus sp. LEGE 07076]MBE9183826.1 hypothetical protein [Microcoleus sp. LEGE 07076]